MNAKGALRLVYISTHTQRKLRDSSSYDGSCEPALIGLASRLVCASLWQGLYTRGGFFSGAHTHTAQRYMRTYYIQTALACMYYRTQSLYLLVAFILYVKTRIV